METKLNETILEKYAIALVVGAVIIFVFCIAFLIYRYKTKENAIYMSNMLAVIIGIEWYNHPNKNEPEIDGYLEHLPIVSYDLENLKQLFKSLNYNVMTNNDKLEWSAVEIEQFLQKDVVNELSDDMKQYDGLIVSVSSHGIRDNIITSSYEKVDKTAIHRIISRSRTDGKHKRIRDIPRVFIFDSCAGYNSRQRTIECIEIENAKGAKGIEYAPMQNEWTSSDKNPDYNLLKIDAANTGFQAFGNSVQGSYLTASFVEKVNQQLENNNYKLNKQLISIFEEIQDELHDKGKQLIQINPTGRIMKHISLKRNDNDNDRNMNMNNSNAINMEHKSKTPRIKSRQSYSQCLESDDEQLNIVENALKPLKSSIIEMNTLEPLKSRAPRIKSKQSYSECLDSDEDEQLNI